MNPILRNVLAVIAGIIIGSAVNMGIIMLNGSLIALPEGVDPASMESLKEHMPSFKPKHFIFPFLAHALGTLVGAFTAARLAVTQRMNLGLLIGVFFLLGGIKVAMDLPGPMWFNILDIVGAYIPMAYFGAKLGLK